MKPIRALALVRYDRDLVWRTVRDELPALATLLSDVRSVETTSRRNGPGDEVELINLWEADVAVPAILSRMVRPDAVRWTDVAKWSAADHVCRWSIEPHLFAGAIRCQGATRYEAAMGGRGTRLTLTGEIEIARSTLPAALAKLGAPAVTAIESMVTTVVPRNLTKLAAAVTRHLAAG